MNTNTIEETRIFCDLQAERAVLASAMIDPDASMRLGGLLASSDYFAAKNGQIHEAIIALTQRGTVVDMLTIADELSRKGQLADVGGHAYLAKLDAPTSAYIEHYSAIVARHSWLRRFISMAGQSVQFAYEHSNPDEVFAHIQEQLKTLQPPKRNGITMTWEESFERTFKMLEELEQAGDSRYRWPWDSWNAILQPAEAGLVVEIVADTAIGKSIVAECLADFWSKHGVCVGFLHYELNPDVMLQRRLCRWTGLDLRAVKTANKTREEWDRIWRVQERLDNWPGRIDYGHTAGMNVDDTVLEMERMQDVYGTELLIIDHMKKLHAVASPRQMRLRLSRTEREADNIGTLKDAAERLGLRMVVLNHYNKTGKAAGESATTADIGGAGEQSDLVNVILLLSRSIARFPETDPFTNRVVVKPGERSNVLQVRVGKNTMGAADRTFRQWMDPAHFSVIDRDYADDTRVDE